MNDYMQALHQRFCREPDRPELERALDDAYHALRENITRQDQELLLRVQDLEIELREETSLVSFIAGFHLGMGIERKLAVRLTVQSQPSLRCSGKCRRQSDSKLGKGTETELRNRSGPVQAAAQHNGGHILRAQI